MRFGNGKRELRGALVGGLVIGIVLAGIMIVASILSPDWGHGPWYLPLMLTFFPCVLLGSIVSLTLLDSVYLDGDWVEHRIFNRWIIARIPIVEFERMDSPSGVFAAVLRFKGGRKIRIPGAHLGILGALESELKKRRRELKQQDKLQKAGGGNTAV